MIDSRTVEHSGSESRSAPSVRAEPDPRERIARPEGAAGPGQTRKWSPPENDRSCVH